MVLETLRYLKFSKEMVIDSRFLWGFFGNVALHSMHFGSVRNSVLKTQGGILWASNDYLSLGEVWTGESGLNGPFVPISVSWGH